jgi:hypothetical protein
MDPFHHASGLGAEGGGHDVVDAKLFALARLYVADVNCVPLSAGTPNQATQPTTKFFTQVLASVFRIGMASTQSVDRSMIVNRYMWPSSDVGREPAKLICGLKQPT